MAVEWWIVLATLGGPVIAVQTQKWIERATEKRRVRNQIFAALMANRSTRLADEFIRPLNLIDINFLPGRWWSSRKDAVVINAWRVLFGELSHGLALNADDATTRAWRVRCDDRLVELLSAMSTALGYSFTPEELRRGIYYPQGRADMEQAQIAMLHGLGQVFSGHASIPMAITHFPVNEDVARAQAELARKAVGAYDEKDGALRVKQIG